MKAQESHRIEKMTGTECRRLQALWQAVFSEDSAAFTEYYFAKKAHRNLGFAVYEERAEDKELQAASVDHHYLAMLYLTPYQVMLKVRDIFFEYTLHYIVGVATRQEWRGQGLMRTLLRTALQEMHKKGEPFTFLMPADPAIYRPFGFHYIYDRPIWEYRDQAALPGSPAARLQLISKREFDQLISYVNQKLTDQYQVFIKRDKEYYDILAAELKAQSGGIYISREEASGVESGGQLNGYLLYARENDQPFIQEALWDEMDPVCYSGFPISQRINHKPIIMARIVDLAAMIALMRTREGVVDIVIEILDYDITANHGSWHLQIAADQAKALKIPVSGSDQAVRAAVQADIGDFTAFLFGYKNVEESFCWREGDTEKKRDICRQLKQIVPLEKVFLNEVV